MLMFLVVAEELGVHLEHPVEGEATDTQHLADLHARHLRRQDGRETIDLPDFSLDFVERLRIDQVCLVQNDAVREGKLLHRLVLDTLRFLLVQMLQQVPGVHDGDDAVEEHAGLDEVVGEKGLCDRRRVRESCRLDDNSVQPCALGARSLQDVLQTFDEVAAHGATNAAVVHLYDLFGAKLLAACGDQCIVDADLTKLVLDHRESFPVGAVEDVIEQRRLPAAQKPRDEVSRHLVFRCELRFLRACLTLHVLESAALIGELSNTRILRSQPSCSGELGLRAANTAEVHEDVRAGGPEPRELLAGALNQGGRELLDEAAWIRESQSLLRLGDDVAEGPLERLQRGIDELYCLEVTCLGASTAGLIVPFAPKLASAGRGIAREGHRATPRAPKRATPQRAPL
mmetsp:Transcript_64808/g.180383  ORF Transcript_64808/g.180383 Transcript_64808/m.180383 type:complete len:400 (+) Transcript_64808:396-1595(+)